MNNKLSKKSLELLDALFDEKSNLQIPVGLVDQVIEIRNWTKERIKEIEEEKEKEEKEKEEKEKEE